MKPLSEFPLIILTPRLELRTLDATHENAEMIYNAMNRSRDYIEAFQGFLEHIKSSDDVMALLQKRIQQRAGGRHAMAYFMIMNLLVAYVLNAQIQIAVMSDIG